MDKNRSVHFNFSFETLPVIFHSQVDDFFKYLDRDGLKFLEYWWDHMSLRVDDDKNEGFEGTSFEVREVPEKKARVVLVTLPKPKHFYEVYYIACVKTPKMRFPPIPNTHVFVLEYVPKERSASGTFFGEITPRTRFLRLCEGPEIVDLDTFYQYAYDEMWAKKKRSKKQ
jgi:hypothetical protein